MVSATSSAVTTRLSGVALARLPIRSSYLSLSMRCIQSPSIQPGRDRVHADLGAEVPGQRLGEVDHRRLARRVGQRLRAGPQADDARGVHDAGRSAFCRSGSAARVTWNRPRTLTANTRSHSSSDRRLEVLRLPGRGGAGVVDEDVEAAEARARPASIIARTPASSLTSHLTSSVFAPSFSASAAVSRACGLAASCS